MASSSQSERKVPMRVIVCGLHRTGTLTTQAALHQLGFHQCYHMETVSENPITHPLRWVDALESKFGDKRPFTLPDWDSLLSTSQAVVDMPAALFGPELAELYPDAKVIIQTRDPEAWHASVLNTMYKHVKRQPWWLKAQIILCAVVDVKTRNMGKLFGAIGRLVIPFDYGEDKDKAIRWFEHTYEEFRTRIPRERWVEWKVQDGWGPLCEHLGVPVPTVRDEKTGAMVEAPFPRMNEGRTFNQKMERMMVERRRRALEIMYGLLGRFTVLGLFGYGGWLLYKTRIAARFLQMRRP